MRGNERLSRVCSPHAGGVIDPCRGPELRPPPFATPRPPPSPPAAMPCADHGPVSGLPLPQLWGPELSSDPVVLDPGTGSRD
eukprot:305173-Chlamydomonas_euryale.AAC.1